MAIRNLATDTAVMVSPFGGNSQCRQPILAFVAVASLGKRILQRPRMPQFVETETLCHATNLKDVSKLGYPYSRILSLQMLDGNLTSDRYRQ
jgi:hypothetical protein